MERVSRDGGIVAVARTNEDVCAALSDRGVDCVDVVASEGEPLTVDGVVGVSVAPDGEVSVFRPVSREFIEAEMERWSGLLERLGNVGDDV